MAGLTGSVTVFQAELDALLNPRLFIAQQSEKPLALDDLVTRVQQSLPEVAVTSIDLTSDRRRSVQMFVKPRNPETSLDYDQVFVDA